MGTNFAVPLILFIMNEIELLKLVNSSGYPFQLHITQLITETESSHGWNVISNEHSWESHSTGKNGFIDIILESSDIKYRNYKAVIECKKTENANWIFLTNHRQQNPLKDISCLHGVADNTRKIYIMDYLNLLVNPEAIESNFCVVRNQDDKNQKVTMLEGLCTHLIESMECLLNQDIFLARNNAHGNIESIELFYLPIIVTNANLVICDFDPSNVDPNDGKLKLENVSLRPVNYIKFKKTLTSQVKSYPIPGNNLHELAMFNKTYERTVFIVKSTEIVDFLDMFEITKVIF